MTSEDKSRQELIKELREMQVLLSNEEKSRQENEDYFQLILDSFLGISYRLDDELRLVSVSGAVQRITAYSVTDFIDGHIRWKTLIHPHDLPALLEDKYKVAPGNNLNMREYRIIGRDGKTHWLYEVIQTIRNEEEKIHVQGIILDITNRRHAEEELKEKSLRLDGILNSLQDVVWSISPDTFDLLYLNPAAERVYGYPVQQFYENPELWTAMIHPDDSDPVVDKFATLLERGSFESEFRIIRPDGETRLLNRRGYFGRDALGAVARIDGIDTDITERRRTEEKLVYLSLHDSLTGLYNRTYFEQEMQRVEAEKQAQVGLIVCDVDGLKLVNDNLGHDSGDKLLVAAANAIRECFRKGDVVARIGGDEFAILLSGVDENSLIQYCRRIENAVDTYNQERGGVVLSISTGYADRKSASITMNLLFRQADQRMYSNKIDNSQNKRKIIAQSIIVKLQGSSLNNDEKESLLKSLVNLGQFRQD